MNQMRPVGRTTQPSHYTTGGKSLPKLKQFECGIHAVTYMAIKAGCPVCDAERQVEQMRNALRMTKNELALLKEENGRLKIQTDIMAAIREAAPTLDDNDLGFLKAVLYEFRDEKSVGLKTTHGARKKRRDTPAPNGFIAMPRKGDPYGHACTSVGGLAIAEYFDEATNSFGGAQAMVLLVRGMSAYLPGAMK